MFDTGHGLQLFRCILRTRSVITLVLKDSKIVQSRYENIWNIKSVG